MTLSRPSMKVVAIVWLCNLVLAAAITKTCYADEVIRLRYGTHFTDRHKQFTQGISLWLKDIERATQGRVQITPYTSGTLFKARDTLDAVKGGITDIGTAFIGFFPGRFPASEVVLLPCIGMGERANAEQATKVMMQAYEKYPEIQAEFADYKFFFFYSIQPAFIASATKPVKRLNDLKGMKIRVVGSYTTKFIEAQGGVPVLMPPADMYQAMQRKVIDGYTYSWDGFMSRKMYEVTKYILDCRWYVGAFFTIMNKDKWQSLPNDVKRQIEHVSGLEAALRCAKAIDSDTEPAIELCAKRGIAITKLSPRDISEWQNAAKSIWQQWIDNLVAAKGITSARAREILDDTRKLYEKYMR